MSTTQYAVVAESADGRQLVGDRWENRYYYFTWQVFDSRREADDECWKFQRDSFGNNQIRNIHVEERHRDNNRRKGSILHGVCSTCGWEATRAHQ